MSDVDDLAQAMTEAFELVENLATAKGFCPGCFLPAFAHAVLSFAAQNELRHLPGARAIATVEDGEDHIGETQGNA